MPLPNSSALTLKIAGRLLNVLITNIKIISSANPNGIEIQAIWDTGCTNTTITANVANILGLVPTGMCVVSTANGTVNRSTYTVTIILPNNVGFKDITVTETDGLSSGCEALIGMDIIMYGDFSITNHNSTTCMSFRLPSSHEIDYVKNYHGVKL